MATPLILPPPQQAPPNFDGNPPAPPQPPGTYMTRICFRDQLWLNTNPLDRNLIFDYFALSSFYDWTCNSEQLPMRSIHPPSPPSLMTGTKFMRNEVMEPNLFVIRKQKRDSPEKVTPMLTYYVLDGLYIKRFSFVMCLLLELDGLCITYQRLLLLLPQKLEKIGYVILPMNFSDMKRDIPDYCGDNYKVWKERILLQH